MTRTGPAGGNAGDGQIWNCFFGRSGIRSGTASLREYSGYSDHVVSFLRQALDSDAPLAELAAGDSQAQLERNVLWQSSVEGLAALLADLRVTWMEVPLDAETERHAAETLLEWYELEWDEWETH